MKFIAIVIAGLVLFFVIKLAFGRKNKFKSIEKEVNPNFLDKKQNFNDIETKEIAKNKTRQILNEKFNLGGKHDDKINNYAGKIIDKVGAKNILKVTSIFEKVKR